MQVNARVDYLDLNTKAVGNGVVLPGNVLNGGTQIGYQGSVIWNPIEYVRFLVQYSHIVIDGGPNAGVVRPLQLTTPVFRRSFSTDQIGLRTQFEF